MIPCWGWTTPLSAEMFIWGLPSACWDQGELWKSKSNPVAGTQKEGAAWDFQWILHGIPHRIPNGFPMDWSPYDFRQAQLGDTTLRLDAETQRRKDLEVRALRGAGDDEGLMRGWCLMVDDWALWFWVMNMFYIFIVPGSPATASRHYQRFGSKARLCYWSSWKRWSLAPRKTKLIVCRLCSVLRFLVFFGSRIWLSNRFLPFLRTTRRNCKWRSCELDNSQRRSRRTTLSCTLPRLLVDVARLVDFLNLQDTSRYTKGSSHPSRADGSIYT